MLPDLSIGDCMYNDLLAGGAWPPPLNENVDSKPSSSTPREFDSLLNEVRQRQFNDSGSSSQGIVGALKSIDHAFQNFQATSEAALNTPATDMLSAHRMRMKLEHDSFSANMLFHTATAVAGSVKSTLSQLIKNQ